MTLSTTLKQLFESLYNAPHEDAVEDIILSHPEIFRTENWYPLGGDEKMFGIVRNQQSNPIAAIVEKLTNSIDAILLKKCHEAGIAPQSTQAPKSMEEAIALFFPEHKQWDLSKFRREQAKDIQIIADGPRGNTSVIIYDNGEGQHPEDFENTFLSLVRGNKINIHFVQGKYNMGGSGALVFCGKKRYQLIASKRYNGLGKFGFTLVRQHKIDDESDTRRYSHFEYLKLDEQIPAFDSQEMDLRLLDRKFNTGTLIKLYSYQFPSGYSGFAQELNQSLNEFLFEPVLPIYTIDKKERYPNNNVLELDLFGLKRRLGEDKGYVETSFTEEYTHEVFGRAKVTCYVFKPKLEGYDVKETKNTLQRRFFKNNMSVVFSVNGQVHGNYTSEFITRTLKFNLLRDYLLIHVDCTEMKPSFREELFMASRDRLKQGDESNMLRTFLGKKLQKSQLDEINRHRKESIGLQGEDATELVRSFAKNLPKDAELFKLLHNTLKLEEKKGTPKSEEPKKAKEKTEPKPFNPQRFPSLFKLHSKAEGIPAISLPINGEKTLKFDTDVSDDYFDRTEEPGELQLALLNIKRSTRNGGDRPGNETEISGLLNVVKSSPNKGSIKLTLNPTKDFAVGDEAQIQVSLTTPSGEPLQQILQVKVTEPEAEKETAPKEDEGLAPLGLPALKPIHEKDWENLGNQGITMNHNTVLYTLADGDKIETIYINLDSRVFKDHRKKLRTEEQINLAEKKFLSSVYFHALFLYMISKKRNYSISQKRNGEDEDVPIDSYLADVFENHYGDFLLNFGMQELLDNLN